MGCRCSQDTKPSFHELQGTLIRPKLTPEDLSNSKTTLRDLTAAINAIKKNDAFLISKLLQDKQPNQVLIVSDFNSNFLHFAAKYNAYKAAELIIQWIKTFAPNIYPSFVNNQDMNGRTPAMVCAFYDSPETLYVLLSHGEIKKDTEDQDEKNLKDLCKLHSITCSLVLEKVENSTGSLPYTSLKHAVVSIARLRAISNALSNVVLMKAVGKKLKSLVHKPDIKAIVSQNNKNIQEGLPVKQKKVRNFDKEVVWCTSERHPCFDIKYDKMSASLVFDETQTPTFPASNGSSFKKYSYEWNDLKFDQKNKRSAEFLTVGTRKPNVEQPNNKVANNYNSEVLSDGSNEDLGSEGYNDEEDNQEIDHGNNEHVVNPKPDEHEHEDHDFLAYCRLISLNTPNQSKLDTMSTTTKTFYTIQHHKSSNNHFIDDTFQHGQDTLGQEWLAKNRQVQIHWHRPHEIFGSDYNQIYLFDNIDPHDIEQGQLGVCYFLAAVSALAEFPERVKKIFMNSEANHQGVYGVKFYIQGIPTEIIVDDYIPCTKQNALEKMNPIFSRPKGNELWVLLLEKAWAKLFGSYSIIESGISDEAFEHILGVPSFLYLAQHQSIDRIWKKIYNADKNNYIISASTYQGVSEQTGLAAAHTYSVISAQEIEGHRILKLRNPWARFEWNGDFSDSSALWTARLKEEMGYVDADDGMFCMTVEDFKKYFMGYVIAEYRDYWSYSYITGINKPKKASYFKFRINEPTEVYLRVHQRNERFKHTAGYAPADFRIAKLENNGSLTPLVFKPCDTDDTAIFGHHSISPTRHHKLYLKSPGEYLVRVKMLRKEGKQEGFTLSSYAAKKIEFERVENVESFLTGIFLHIGNLAKHKEEMDLECYIARGFSGFNHYIYAENKGIYTWNLLVRFPILVNAVLGKPYRTEDNTFDLVLLPGEKKVVYLKVLEPKNPKTYINPEFASEWY